MADPSGRPV